MSVVVPKLEISKIKPHTIILIVGKRRTGKSVLLRDLMYHLRARLAYGVAFTPTEQSAEMFAEFMPRSCIYNEFRYEVIEDMLKFQRRCKPEDKRPLFCVLDDCLSDKKVLSGPAMNDLFMNGRHQQITLLLVAQDVMALGPQLRGNVDILFAFKDTVITNRRKLFDHFFGVCQKYDTFSKLMNQTTNDRRTIVLDTTGDSNDMQQSVFWYRAEHDLPKFFIGRRSFYRMSLQYQRPTGSRPVRALDPTKKVSEIAIHLLDDENNEEDPWKPNDDKRRLSDYKEAKEKDAKDESRRKEESRRDSRRDERRDGRRDERRDERDERDRRRGEAPRRPRATSPMSDFYVSPDEKKRA